MAKILWLASWYPNEAHPLEGDFVQRQARALALYEELTVIYVTKGDRKFEEKNLRIENNKKGNLTEFIIHYRAPQFFLKPVHQFVSFIKYHSAFKVIIRDYLKKNGVPEIVHVHVPFKAGRPGLWLQGKFKIRLLVTEHWAGYDDKNPDNYFSRPYYFRRLVRRALTRANCIVPVSRDLGMKLQALFGKLPIKVISNTVDENLFFLKQSNIPPFRFIHNTAAFERQKNTKGLLEVLAQLNKSNNSWECIIFGKYSKNLRDRSHELGLDNQVVFTGEIPYPKVAEWMQSSSFLVNFSRYENQPCTILEALCCGLAVIATRVGGIPEIINSRNGILIESENEDQLLSALEEMISGYDRFNREEISAQARAAYGFVAIGKEISALYKDLMKGQSFPKL